MKNWLTTLCLFILGGVLVGCATPEGIRRTEPSGTIQYTGMDLLLSGVQPIASIEQGSEIKIYIDDQKSPSFLKHEKKQNFELVTIQGKQGQYYRVTVKSLCACLGFKKKIMVPWTLFVDSGGKEVEGRPTISGPESFERGLPAYIKAEYSGVFEADGVYTVFVSADLSREAQERYKHVLLNVNNGLVSGTMSFIFLTRSFGEVIVAFE